MVISSSPARSNAHSFTAATRSTTSTGFIWRSPAYSMRDMPPPGAGAGVTRHATMIQAPCASRRGWITLERRESPRGSLYLLRACEPKWAGRIHPGFTDTCRSAEGAPAPPAQRQIPESIEQARDRFFSRRAPDRLADQGGNRQHPDVAGDPHRLGRLDRIGDDELVEARGGQTGDGAAGQHAVADIGIDRGRSLLEQGVGGVDQGAAGIDDVVHQNAGVALDLADHVHDLGLARPRARTTPPTSGETTIRRERSKRSLMSRTITGEA